MILPAEKSLSLTCDGCGGSRVMKRIYIDGPCPFIFDCHGSVRAPDCCNQGDACRCAYADSEYQEYLDSKDEA